VDDIVAQPASVNAIAAELVVTDAAVKQHLLHLYDKLRITAGGEPRRVALAREAIRRGLVDSPARAAALPPEARLREGRDAFARREWEHAARLLATAHDAADLVLLGEALLWANRHDDSFTAKERAYQAYLRAGEDRRAGYVAALLTFHNAVRLDMAVA